MFKTFRLLTFMVVSLVSLVGCSPGPQLSPTNPPFKGARWESEKWFEGHFWTQDGYRKKTWKPVRYIEKKYVCDDPNVVLYESIPVDSEKSDLICSLEYKEIVANDTADCKPTTKGAYAVWTKDGYEDGETKNARFHGVVRLWHGNGVIRSVREFQANRYEGLCQVWDRDGSMKSHQIMEDMRPVRGTRWNDGETQTFGQDEDMPIVPATRLPAKVLAGRK